MNTRTPEPDGGPELAGDTPLPLETMGSRLRTARKNAGKTLDDVAHLADISKSYLSDLENGKLANPSITVIGAIAEVLGVSVGWLTEGSPQLNPDAVAALGPRTFDLGARYLLDIAGEFAEEADNDLADHNPNLAYDAVRLQLAQVWATAGLAAEVHDAGEKIGDLLEEVITRMGDAPEPAAPERVLDKIITECRRYSGRGVENEMYRRGLAFAITALGGQVPLDHLKRD